MFSNLLLNTLLCPKIDTLFSFNTKLSFKFILNAYQQRRCKETEEMPVLNLRSIGINELLIFLSLPIILNMFRLMLVS